MNKKILFIGIGFICLLVLFVVIKRTEGDKKEAQVSEFIKPVYGSIQTSISTTGTVEPQNRLEIKPPIGGRIEEILVKEGEKVKTGQVLALMSSTERATLLDAARLQGKETMDYWKKVYKATPLVAPINGEVIVRSVEPGQTISASDAVIVLSDRLIVQAEVDETDIGKVKVGQNATIKLDAYPEVNVDGKVDHISYESTVVNNVTIYKVDIVPKSVPDIFRSGMSANVEIIENKKDHALLIPLKALGQDNKGLFVMVSQGQDKEPVRKAIETGVSNGENVEVVAGLTENDTVVIVSQKYELSDGETANNPFFPSRKKDNETKKDAQ